MRFHVTVLSLGIAALLSLLPYDRAAAQTEIRCPLATLVALNWKDKVGSDPTFKVNSGTQYLEPRLVDISWAGGQVITCNYSLFGGGVVGTYAYTVQRRIRACEHRAGSSTMPPRLLCSFLR